MDNENESKNNLHLVNDSKKEDPSKYLLNNYIFFVDKLFKQPKICIENILKNKDQSSNILTNTKSKDPKELSIIGQSLKDEIKKNPSGNAANELYEITHISNLKNCEQLIKRNSFYMYTQKLFICLHQASRNYFFASMKQLCGYAPKKIEHSEFIGLKILNFLTFMVSSYTTAYGVNHLLQNNSLAILSAFNGNEGEIPRIITSFICGCLLSLIIFHLKSSLFKGILSAGKIWKGITQTYRKHPSKIIFATLILSISLKTNYDGGIALISKSEYINEQYQLINKQATTAYDDYNSIIPSTPSTSSTSPKSSINKLAMNSFNQSVMALKQSTQKIILNFKKFPSEEDDGIASSGHSGQGPRYRGKSFIIEGGYDKNNNTVSKFSKNYDLANEVDTIIQSTGVNYKLSLETKINRLLSKYENSVMLQKKQVEAKLLELDRMVKSMDSVLPRFLGMSFVEYYDLNRIVKDMAQSFVLNAKEYDDTVTQLKSMMDQYIQVLSKIDRSGNARARDYKVSVTFPQMNVSEILALTKGLPEVKYMSFDELISLLKGKYGLMWAQIVMLCILVISVLIDLADVVFLSPSLASRGRRELEMIPSKEDELNDWEEKFLKQCYMFLYDDDVAQIYNQLIPTKSLVLIDAFYQLLEEVNPQVMDSLDKKISTHLWDYLKSDFRPLHAHTANLYNERVKAIEIINKNPEHYLNRYLEIIFPFLNDIIEQSDFTFDEIDRRVQSKQNQILNRILERVEFLSLEADTPSLYSYYKSDRLLKKLLKMDNKISQQLKQLQMPEQNSKDNKDNKDNKDKKNGRGNKRVEGAKEKIKNSSCATDYDTEYNIVRIENMKKMQANIQKELDKVTRELENLRIRARNYLIADNVEINTFTLWWKMAKSFLSNYYSFRIQEGIVSKIISRRKWLSMMSHRIDKPQQEVSIEKKDSYTNAQAA
ncbi:MAG: hypothetical protein HQK51_08050 [Oligoflexia bacterium]|nr:hypothetical protein [Oligoflexia bacterium]